MKTVSAKATFSDRAKTLFSSRAMGHKVFRAIMSIGQDDSVQVDEVVISKRRPVQDDIIQEPVKSPLSRAFPKLMLRLVNLRQ
jgi:hypothetical protein